MFQPQSTPAAFAPPFHFARDMDGAFQARSLTYDLEALGKKMTMSGKGNDPKFTLKSCYFTATRTREHLGSCQSLLHVNIV